MKLRAHSVTNFSSILTVIISLMIAFSIPTAYFIISYQYMAGTINTEMAFSARAVEELVIRNPNSWQFEEIRLQEMLERRLDRTYRDNRIIRDLQGHVIAETRERLARPVLTFRQLIYDSGVEVAHIEIERSIAPLVVRTAFIGACSALLGIMIFLIFYFFSLRDIRKAYHTLEENEKRLTLALTSGYFGVWDWDIEKSAMVWNDRMYEIYGVSRASVKEVFETWQKGIHLEDRDRVLENVRTGTLGERSYSADFRIVRPDGTVRYIRCNGIAMRNIKGESSRIIGLYNDITDQKRTEEERERLILELKEALSQVKTLGGLLPICSWCKKIRNDKGYWEQMEIYIREHSEAEFSHSICPECTEKLYPEVNKRK